MGYGGYVRYLDESCQFCASRVWDVVHVKPDATACLGSEEVYHDDLGGVFPD